MEANPSRPRFRFPRIPFWMVLGVVFAVLLNAFIVLSARKRKREQAKVRESAEAIALYEKGMPPPGERDHVGALERSALSGGDKLAKGLKTPPLPPKIKGVVNPDEERKEKSYRYDPDLLPPPYDQKGMRLTPQRLRQVHEAGDSGWGYTSPAGFVQDPEDKGIWRADGAAVRVASSDAEEGCRFLCGDEVLDVARTKRSTASGRRTFTFKCGKGIELGGKEWKGYERTVLQIEDGRCIVTTLAFDSERARQSVGDEYFIMRRRLAPLPPLPPKPLFDEKGRGKKARPLR